MPQLIETNCDDNVEGLSASLFQIHVFYHIKQNLKKLNENKISATQFYITMWFNFLSSLVMVTVAIAIKSAVIIMIITVDNCKCRIVDYHLVYLAQLLSLHSRPYIRMKSKRIASHDCN